jgi:hypothetical protein
MMIDPGLYAGFVAAVIVLMLIPGPCVAFIVANSLSYGPRYGLVTVAGTSSAVVVQLVPTVLGLSALMTQASGLFGVLRWAPSESARACWVKSRTLSEVRSWAMIRMRQSRSSTVWKALQAENCMTWASR